MENELFSKATKEHANNNLDLAEKLYLKILDKFPKEDKVLFLIGTLYIQKKNYKKAIKFLLQALDIDSSNDHILMNLGIAYQENHNFVDSERMFNKSLQINPNNANTLNNLANLYLKNQHYELAIDYFKKAISINKSNANYYINLAESYACIGEYQNSIDLLLNIDKKSEYFNDSQLRLFNLLYKIKNYTNCIEVGEVLLNKPLNQKDLNQILNNLIHAALELGDVKKAKHLYLKQTSHDENYLFNEAQIHAAEDKINDAIAGYESLIRRKKNITQSFHNLGILYFRQGHINKAINKFNEALKINPDLHETRKILGMCQLSQCNFKYGWSNFLSYSNNPIYSLPFLKIKKLWDGTGTNKTILILLDQGVGDQIFYASMLNRLNFLNTYICMVDPKLKFLFINSFSKKIQFISSNEIDSIPFDFYVRGADLAKLFIRNKDDLLKQKPYLVAKNPALKEKNIIGISWHSKNKFIGMRKSIDLKVLISTLKPKANTFINLQYGDFRKEILKISNDENITFIDSSNVDNFNDMEGLAGLILACDEIYTISNTTAHLAAALGVKVNLLLPSDHQANTWYWFHAPNKTSLWYPNVHIFEAKPRTSISTALDSIK